MYKPSSGALCYQSKEDIIRVIGGDIVKTEGHSTERTPLGQNQQGVIRCESGSQRGLCDSKYQWLDKGHGKSGG